MILKEYLEKEIKDEKVYYLSDRNFQGLLYISISYYSFDTIDNLLSPEILYAEIKNVIPNSVSYKFEEGVTLLVLDLLKEDLIEEESSIKA